MTLPSNWEWTTLREISKEIYRYPTFYGMEHLEEGIPVIRGEHIKQDGTISHDWSDYWYVSQVVSNTFPKTIVEENDLIMSVRGSIGKIGIIDSSLVKAQVSPNCIRISTKRNLCFPRFLLHYLKSAIGQTLISDNVNATTIQTIKASLLSLTPVPLPPLPEQERIVERIESLFTQLEAGVAALKRARAALKRYKASVLKAACEGRLVAQEAGDESAEVMLRRILAEKGEVYRAPEGELGELPRGWVWVTLEELSNNIVDCLHSTPKFAPEGKYCIDTTCIESGRILFEKARCVSEETYIDRIRRLKPEIGDILFSREGTIGTTVVIPEGVELCLGQRMMMFRPSNAINSSYFMWAMLSNTFERQWKPKIIGTTSPHINIRDIRQMTLPLPPYREQLRIVAEVERRMSVVQELEVSIESSIRRAGRLRQVILKNAFEGRL